METALIVCACIIGALILLYLLFLLAIKPSPRKHEIIERNKNWLYAHRGFFDRENGIPENSCAAFKRAVDNGYGFEFDVRLSKDKKLMIMHDDHIERMTGKDIYISQTDSEELRELRLLGSNEKIPYLSELLEIVDGKVPLIIELKVCRGNQAELCNAVCAMLDSYKGDYMLESFDPFAIRWLMKNRPELCRGQLLTYFHKYGDKEPNIVIDFILHNLLTTFATKPDFIAMSYEDRRTFAMRTCKRLYGVTEVNWTIRSQEHLDDCLGDNAIPIFEGFTPSQSSHAMKN